MRDNPPTEAWTFGLWGLKAGNLLMAKTLFRFYNETHGIRWRYALLDCETLDSAPSSVQVDLLVVDAAAWQSITPPDLTQRQMILYLGDSAPEHGLCLPYPLHAPAFHDMLAEIDRTLAGRSKRAATRPASMQAASVADDAAWQSQRHRLKRWPSNGLLKSQQDIKLATLLTGQPLSLDDLVEKSGLSKPVCTAFVEQLRNAQLIQSRANQPSAADALPKRSPRADSTPTSAAAKPTGRLMSLIRSRLGLT